MRSYIKGQRCKRGRYLVKKLSVHMSLIVGSIVFSLPFLWLVSTSLKPDDQIFMLPPKWIPNPVMWSNYSKALEYAPIVLYARNTLYVTVMSIAGTVISCPLVAYGFARFRWPGRNVLFMILLSTMMLPPQVTMIPLFLIFREMNLLNTFVPLYIRTFFGTPFYIFLLRQFILTIPTSIEDAARVDGCGYLATLYRILLPMLKPALITVVIFQFTAAWNDFVNPLIYINRQEYRTLALGLETFQAEFNEEWALLMAASTMMLVPVVLIFFFFQRYFISGVVMTGLKE